MSKKKDFKNDLMSVFYIDLAVIILILTMFNLYRISLRKTVVLGASTDNTYWEELVQKHPTYRDAWIELGRLDKVEEIDPNFFK